MLIKVNDERYVAGFNSQHQIIQLTSDCARAKSFASAKSALAFVGKYGNAGYGLDPINCTVVAGPHDAL